MGCYFTPAKCRLYILEKNTYCLTENIIEHRKIVLISCWGNDIVDQVFSDFIIHLINKGCIYFVCVGQYAEFIHDRIDDIIVYENKLDVMTTYHIDQSFEEVAYFFINLTELSVHEGTCFVAFLDFENKNDHLLLDEILRICHCV